MLLFARSWFAALLVVALLPAQARAAELLYELTGPQTATFTLPAAPSPDNVLSDGFRINGVAVLLDGSSITSNIGFANILNGGGLQIDGTAIDLTGSQLFSGTLSAPTLLQGQFALASINNPSASYTLIVRPAAAAVPEPSAWLLLMLGFGAVGAAMRRFRLRPMLTSLDDQRPLAVC